MKTKDKKGYDALEKGLIGILEKKDEGYILQQLEKSAEQKNEDVFALAYVYLGTQGEEFYNKFLKFLQDDSIVLKHTVEEY